MKIRTIISTVTFLVTALQAHASFTLGDVLDASPTVSHFTAQAMNLHFGDRAEFRVGPDEFAVRFFKYNWPGNDDNTFQDAIDILGAGGIQCSRTEQAPNAIYVDDARGHDNDFVKQQAIEMGLGYTLSLACLSEGTVIPTIDQVLQACKAVATWKPNPLTYPASEDSLVTLADGKYQIRYFRFYLGEDQSPTFADYVKARDLAAIKPSEREEKGDKILTFISEDKKSFVLSLGKVD